MNTHHAPRSAAVYGLQYGDEGKGKIIDFLSSGYEIGVRCQGGDNAGHTIYIGDAKQVLHVIPSSILRHSTVNIIGNGVVVNPFTLIREIEELRGKGLEINLKRLVISDRAHLIFPYHLLLDAAQDFHTNIGTTLKGIGPAYTSKASRTGLRLNEFTERRMGWVGALRRNLQYTTTLLREYYSIPPEELYDRFHDHPVLKSFIDRDQYLNEPALIEWAAETIPSLAGYSADTLYYLHDAYWKQGRSVLFEGAQGALLDIDFGTYPFVTSSNTGVAGIRTGCGLEVPFDRNIGITKAYTTRVGGGPFPTELLDETGAYLQAAGNEFGATTGRKRRCGWLDLVALRYAVLLNNPTELALTKLDVLDGMQEIKVCTAYNLNGTMIDHVPANLDRLKECKPVYTTFPGWQRSIAEAENFEQLPGQTQHFIGAIEQYIQKPIRILSIGKERHQTITR